MLWLHLPLFLHLDIWLRCLLPLQVFSEVLVLRSILLLSPVLNLIVFTFNKSVSEVAHDLLSTLINYLSSNLLERVAFDLQCR